MLLTYELVLRPPIILTNLLFLRIGILGCHRFTKGSSFNNWWFKECM